MIFLEFLIAIVAQLITPFCGCGEQGQVWISWSREDKKDIQIHASCAQPFRTLRFYDGGKDPWE